MSSPLPPPSVGVGLVLGRYRVLEEIGRGGMGVVYRARDEHLDRDVALKVLPPGALRDATTRNRLRREALSLAKLNHPNIATVHDFHSDNARELLVMEYVRGVTLSTKLTRGALAEKEFLEIAQQIVEALEAAHSAGIVHRDLKPSNIIVTANGQVKLLDFGVATLLKPSSAGLAETLTAAPSIPGTLPYMAPEQLKGEPADTRADLYTAGVVLYEMATGHRPFEGKLSTAIANAIINTAPIPPRMLAPGLSPRLEEILLKSLEKDPDLRYQSARELAVDLRRLALPPTSPLSPVPRTRRRPTALTIVSVAVLALLLLLAGGLGSWRRILFQRMGWGRIESLAILPLENQSKDPEEEYLAAGITEALISDLGQIRGLRRVISSSSVMRYKVDRPSLRDIVRQLNVDAVVEGSVLRSGSSVQVTARLVNGATTRVIWSHAYERELRDLVPLEHELALNIAAELNIGLTSRDEAQLKNPIHASAAYEDYLKGSYLNKGTSAQQQSAKKYFEDAIAIDPEYAPAYAGLADYYWSDPQLAPREAMPKAKQYALQALRLDPRLAEAHTALAIVHFYADWDWSGAEAELERAIKLNPSDAEAHRMYSVYLSALGRAEQAQSEIRRAREVDPLNIWTQITAGFAYYFARQYDDAIAQCRRALELEPDSAGANDCLGTSYLAKGMYQQAIASCQKSVESSGGDLGHKVELARAYALSGRTLEARGLLAELQRTSERSYVSPYFMVELNAALGDHEAALRWLEKAYGEHDGYLAWLKVDSALDPLRLEPRFQELLGRLRFPP